MGREAITLVEDGRPRAAIVVAPDIGSVAADAVRDLVRVVGVMSGLPDAPGATLPVVGEADPCGTRSQVHVGRTAFVREAGLVPPGLPMNGYRIVTTEAASGPRLVIAGVHGQGICHGIYDLLANVLGVMWGMPDPAFEEIPARRTVQVGPLDRTERPAFSFRVFSGADPGWTRRSRLDQAAGELRYYGHGHNLFTIITPDEHGDHPEYFALIDGKRQVPKTRDGMGPQPCLTHPDVIRVTVEKARRFFDEHPGTTTFSLCPNDSDRFCQCPACAALDDGMERYRGRRMTSDSYFHYIDAVATEVIRTHPDRYLGTYAYWTTELPPRRIAHLPPNVVVYLTQDSSQYHDPEYEARDRQVLESWAKIAVNLAVYEYYELGWFVPRYYPGIVARTLRHLPTANVKGFYCQTNAYWAHIGPMLYLAARLLWDVRLDERAVLDEWYAAMFHEAAPEMKAYYEALERRWMGRMRAGRWFEGFDWVFLQFVHWSADVREEARRLLDAARAAARSPLVRARIEYIQRGHRFAYLFPRAHEHLLAIRADSPDLEREIRAFSETVNEIMTTFTAGVGMELITAYSPIYVEDRAFRWWKAYLGDLLETLLAGRPDLRDRVISDDPIVADMLSIRRGADDDLKMRIGWAHKEFAAT